MMRIIFKLLALPFALIFTAGAFFFSFLLAASSKIFGFVSGLVFLGAVVLLVMGETTGGIVFIGVAFLVSPYGLPALAGWLANKLGNAGGALRGFIAN